MRTAVILALLTVVSTIAQTGKVTSSNGTGQTWQIPFASTNNTISLAVQNNSGIEAKNISVTFNNLPTWLEFKSNTVLLKSIPANSSGDAEFTFSVDRKGPVGRDTTLTATISSADGQTWTKEISEAVGAPKDYRPYNNLPTTLRRNNAEVKSKVKIQRSKLQLKTENSSTRI